MIKSKSVYYDKTEESDGIRILVMRRWCRPLSKKKAKINEWLPELGPSKRLLDEWNKNLINWDEYEIRYLKEMEVRTGLIDNLAQRAKTETITLLCKEPTDEHCHRRLLKELIDKSCNRNNVP
jgi:uncharacterized protein YeaO (DUF488 family)